MTRGRTAGALRTMSAGDFTPKIATGGGSARFGSASRACSSRKGYWVLWDDVGLPNVRGSSSPDGVGVKRSQVNSGRNSRYRSNWMSLRSVTSPTLMSRASGAIASGVSLRSWRRRSNALSRFADAGDP